MAAVREVIPGTRRYTQHTIYELAASIRERDVITYAHCRRVAIYANRLARAAGWSRRAGRDLALAGLVHDLGKTWIHNDILMKRSALSTDERLEMERHPVIAARILEAYGVPPGLVAAVLHHHEQYDGTGYPDGLVGAAIPAEAQLLAIADVFDVLTSARPYKEAMSREVACDRLLAGAGSHFDPKAVETFVALVRAQPGFVLSGLAAAENDAPEHPAWVRHDAVDW